MSDPHTAAERAAQFMEDNVGMEVIDFFEGDDLERQYVEISRPIGGRSINNLLREERLVVSHFRDHMGNHRVWFHEIEFFPDGFRFVEDQR